MEVSIRYNLCVRSIVAHIINVSLIGLEWCTFNRDSCAVEYVDRSVSKACLNLVELLSSTLSSNSIVELCEFYSNYNPYF